MSIKNVKLKPALFCLFFVGVSVVAPMSTFLAKPAAASGESYAWDGSDSIQATGGQLAGKLDSNGTPAPNTFFLQSNYLPGQTITAKTVLYFYPNIQTALGTATEYGCKANATLTLTSSSAGTINVTVMPPPTGTSIGTPQPQCTQAQVDGLGLSNTSVTIGGSSSGGESQLEKSVDIIVNSPAELGESEQLVQGTLKDSSGKVISGPTTVTVKDQGPDQLPTPEHNAAYPFHYELDPGTYSFCTDKILTSCWSFTKVAHKPIIQELGEKPATRTLEATLSLQFNQPTNQDVDLGPADVQLQDKDGNVLQDITAPENTVKAIPDSQGVAYRSGVVTTSATFDNLSAGTYKVCLTAIDTCQTVVKKEGTAASVTFDLSQDQAGALSAVPRKADCYLSNDPLSWVLCPVFNAAARSADWIFNNILTPFLVTEPVSTSSSNPTFQIWSNFRVYGDIIIVVLLLVAIFMNIFTGGTSTKAVINLRSILPLILGTVILVNLSVYIDAWLVDLTNVIGKTISDIMTAPIRASGQWSFSPNAVQGVGVFAVGLIGFLFVGGSVIGFLTQLFFSGTTGSAAFVKVSLTAAMFVIIPLILAVVAVFITLVVRKGLIMFLIIISPVAFALYALPNTRQYFQKWWDLFLEALLVYPIVVVVFAVADILSVMILTANHISASKIAPNSVTGTLSLDLAQIIAIIVALLLQFGPLVAVPYAFRLAGGTLSKGHELLALGAARLDEYTKNSSRRQNAMHDFNSQKLQGQQTAYNAINAFGEQHKWARRIPIVGTNQLGRVAGGYNIEAAMSAEQARTDKVLRDQIKTGDDTDIRALTVDKVGAMKVGELSEPDAQGWRSNGRYRVDDRTGTREFKTAGGRWVGESAVDRGYQRWGGNHFAQQTALAYEMQKATTQSEIDGLVRAFPGLSQSWGMNNAQANNAWIGAGFANNDNNIEYRYTSLGENGAMNIDAQHMMQDIDEKRGNYKMAQQSAEAWTTMQQEFERARTTVADAAANDAAKQAARETMQRASRIARSMTVVLPDGTSFVNTSGAAGRVAEEMQHFVSTIHPQATPPILMTYAPGHAGQPESGITTRNR